MKKIEIARAIGLADENFVAEAAPAATKTKSIFWRKFAIVAACIALVVTSACLWLFLPYDRGEELPNEVDIKNLPAALEAYADSEYLDLMYTIYKYEKANTYNPNNNFENYIESFLSGVFGYFAPKGGSSLSFDSTLDMDEELFYESANAVVPGATANGNYYAVYDASDSVKSDSNYVETTDNQVAGVTEADLFKRTKTHIFYLDKDELTLRVYSIAGEKSRQVSFYTVENLSGDVFKNVYVNEMFLSSDGSTLTLIGYARVWNVNVSLGTVPYKQLVRIISLDVSDPENIKEKSSFSITGSYSTARVVDGEILLFSHFNMFRSVSTGASEIGYYVPMIDTGDGLAPIPADDIIFPDDITSKYYTVVTKLNESDLSFKGSIACLSYSETVYVSADKVFLTRSYNDYIKRNEDGVKFVDNANMTEITAVSYAGDGFEVLGSISVEGRVKNQYSLDEYEGILRVVTTTSATRYLGDNYLITDEGIYFGNKNGEPAKTEIIASNAALYCIDLSTFKIVGEVRDFAPDGETVESVRFDGTSAYVCTAVVITFTDPVYFFDLSDMSNITYTDTGDIEGYSSSLVNFGEGLLLGIGYGENRNTLKIEVYAEDGNSVVSLASYEVKNVNFATDYKSYFIDRERGLVGLMIDEWNNSYGSRYLLLGFDGYELFEAVNQKFEKSFSPEQARAALADDYFYIMINKEFKAIKLFD